MITRIATILCIVVLLFWHGLLQAQVISNNGAVVNISSGAVVSNTSDVNNTTGTITNSSTFTLTGVFTNAATANGNGTWNIAGNFVNNGTFTAGTSTVNLNGGAAQTIGGTAGSSFFNVTIANTSGGVSLTKPQTVGGTLTLTSGILTTDATNLLTVTNSASTAISSGDGTKFINGPVKWSIGTGTYLFPVGKSTSNYFPFTLAASAASSPIVTVEAFDTDAASGATIDATLSAIYHTEYWSASLNSGSFTGKVSLTRNNALTSEDVIGQSAAQTGTYTSLGGTVASPSITNSNNISTLGFFVMSTKKQTITTGTITGSPFCSGSSVSVPFTITGVFTAGNVFTAQLTDANGAWGTPVTLGTLTQTTAGTISGIIPINTLTSTNYRIRVVSNTPLITGAINISNLTINRQGSWKGSTSADWNNPANWDCNSLPTLTTNVFIAAGKTYYPTSSSNSLGLAKNLTIDSGASVTVSGFTLQIAESISNSGTFTATSGTIEMKGTSAQSFNGSICAGSTIGSLIVNNSANVTLTGALNVTDIVKATLGNLDSGTGYLTLISTATKTALIDGSGVGNVIGTVNMQRYLASAYGYKYVSSPFGSTTGSALSPLSSTATIPTFYYYDENHSTTINSVVQYTSGWVSTLVSSILSPTVGYAANFGASATPRTITLSGTVNNGNLPVTVSNNNRTYTQGFNLVGNPYPSPIDWFLATRTNVNNAIYFFNASGDEWSGVYSSYVNGTTTGDASNIIPSMQGFFVQASAISGTLGFSNAMRTLDSNPTFKAASFDSRPIMKFSASYDQNNAIPDNYVLYLDNKTTRRFDPEFDAVKMINTDISVPNLYEVSDNSYNLSISGIPDPVDSLTRIPMGIKALKNGWINLVATDLSKLPTDRTIYLEDKSNNLLQDLGKNPKYKFYTSAGEINNRFALVMAIVGMNPIIDNPDKLFTLSRLTTDNLLIKVNLPARELGELRITNMLGQLMASKSVSANQTIEVGDGWKSGVYVVTLSSGKRSYSEKTIIR